MCTAKLHELKFVPNAMEIVFENKYFYIISEAVFVSLSLVRSMNRLFKNYTMQAAFTHQQGSQRVWYLIIDLSMGAFHCALSGLI